MTDSKDSPIRRVGLVFSGGPAPAANAVISAAATSFLEVGIEVLGFLRGYTYLERYDPDTHPLVAGEHYLKIEEKDLRGLRNRRGVLIQTARAHPGRAIEGQGDLDDPEKCAPLARVHHALTDLGVDALISIGGDGTLKTANLLHAFQQQRPSNERALRVIHLPKTIDNDYSGIDFTFGYFTAVDFMAKELMNLRADAIASAGYYIVETMGRNASWLAYGVAIAGEAHMVLGSEDLAASQLTHKDEASGRTHLKLDALAEMIVDRILAREARGKHYGTIVLAEGLAGHLAERYLEGVPRDQHGHVALGKIGLAKLVAEAVARLYEQRTGHGKKVNGIQLGYESRCAPPHAFDVLLACQLGVGAYRALVEEQLDGHMVSVHGQFELRYVPFSKLVDPQTMYTEVRDLPPGSDLHRLARILESRTERIDDEA